MAKETCCIAPGELRVLYHDTPGDGIHTVYTVPAGKVFVITSWTMSMENQYTAHARLLRSGARQAFNRVWESLRQHNHLTFPTGIPFAAGDTIQIQNVFNSTEHHLHGYETDA